MNQNERKNVARRMILLIAVACVIMGLYVMRLIFLQLVNGDDFKAIDEGVDAARIEVRDGGGALDFAIRARVRCALRRAKGGAAS